MADLSTPRVAVVVPTYRRAHLLPRLLAALERQSLPASDFEVLVVDDGSGDATADVLDRLVGSSPLRVRAIRCRARGGQAVARNLGWRATTAPVVAFTDDDCEPQPGWLDAGLTALDGAGAAVVVGRTLPRPEHAARLLRPFSRSVDVGEVRFYETCNAFYRRADLEAVGGFDERFTGHGGEDTDLALRVLGRSDGDAVFAPSAVVHHDVHEPSWTARARETLRWTGVPLLVRRHPDARRLLHRRLFWRPAHPATLAAAAGLALAPRRGAAVALFLPWLWHRVVSAPACPGPRRRWLALPGVFALDVLEVAVMLRASARHRVLVL